MNDRLLTGVRRVIFLKIAENPRITQAHLCSFTRARGGEINRLNHHLMGLESEGFIEIIFRGKQGQYQFQITRDKGRKMLKYLQKSMLKELKKAGFNEPPSSFSELETPLMIDTFS